MLAQRRPVYKSRIHNICMYTTSNIQLLPNASHQHMQPSQLWLPNMSTIPIMACKYEHWRSCWILLIIYLSLSLLITESHVTFSIILPVAHVKLTTLWLFDIWCSFCGTLRHPQISFSLLENNIYDFQDNQHTISQTHSFTIPGRIHIFFNFIKAKYFSPHLPFYTALLWKQTQCIL